MADSIRVEHIRNEDVDRLLTEMVGEVVSVTWTRVALKSNGFHTQVCLRGKLEVHPNKAQYRVLLSEDSYAYFEPSDVMAIVPFSKGRRIFIG